jgi:hypothetical protein
MSAADIEQLIQGSPERPSDRDHVFLYQSVLKVTHKGSRQKVFLVLSESYFRIYKPRAFARSITCSRKFCWDTFRTIHVSRDDAQILVFHFDGDPVSISADNPSALVTSVVNNLITIFSPSEFNPQVLTDYPGPF